MIATSGTGRLQIYKNPNCGAPLVAITQRRRAVALHSSRSWQHEVPRTALTTGKIAMSVGSTADEMAQGRPRPARVTITADPDNHQGANVAILNGNR
jgi:hypothetical protein